MPKAKKKTTKKKTAKKKTAKKTAKTKARKATAGSGDFAHDFEGPDTVVVDL